MSRTSWRKLQYAAVISAAALSGIALVWWFRNQPAVMFLLAGLFLIPGRVSGFLWRDLYRGRRLHDQGQFDASAQASRAFLERLAMHPHLGRYWWLAWAVYTRDPMAMALNNLGAAQLELGQWTDSEQSLRLAVQRDPEYPIPHYNLAVLCSVRQDVVGMHEHANTAVRLGYFRNSADRAIEAAAKMLARIEGRGQSTQTAA